MSTFEILMHAFNVYGDDVKKLFTKLLKEQGFDGIIEVGYYTNDYVVFEPDQIKYINNKTPTNSNKLNEEVTNVFYVGKTEVLKNPTDSEYRQLYNEQRKLHPNTNEPLIRQTFGEFGNYYI